MIDPSVNKQKMAGIIRNVSMAIDPNNSENDESSKEYQTLRTLFLDPGKLGIGEFSTSPVTRGEIRHTALEILNNLFSTPEQTLPFTIDESAYDKNGEPATMALSEYNTNHETDRHINTVRSVASNAFFFACIMGAAGAGVFAGITAIINITQDISEKDNSDVTDNTNLIAGIGAGAGAGICGCLGALIRHPTEQRREEPSNLWIQQIEQDSNNLGSNNLGSNNLGF